MMLARVRTRRSLRFGLGRLTTSRLAFAAAIAAASCLSLGVDGASATQRIITWNLRSKYVSPAQSIIGLNPTVVPTAGPTGLRSWIVLPSGYTPTKCWPVLYLLHASDTVEEWLNEAPRYTGLKAIVVIPGGGNTLDTNWWDNGARSPGWESWFFQQLMPKVSASFPICPARSAHAIAGSSMGGYGAFYLASQRPDYFGTAASFSGVIATSDPVIQFGYSFYPLVWGSPGGFYAEGNDPTYLVRNLAHARLFVYVGNGTPVNAEDVDSGFEGVEEAVMREEAADFLSAARAARVKVRFTEHAGIHSQANWDISLADLIASNPFGVVANAPRSWHFTTTQSAGTAWSYRFLFSRPPATIENFSYSKGVLRGTGSGRVTIRAGGGLRFTARMPFVERRGVVSSGGRATPPQLQTNHLPIQLTLRPKQTPPRSSLTVEFKADRTIPPSEAFQISVIQSVANCVLTSAGRVDRSTTRGSTIKFKLSPGTGPGHPHNEWCPGGGLVALDIVQRSTPSFQVGKLVGRSTYDFR